MDGMRDDGTVRWKDVVDLLVSNEHGDFAFLIDRSIFLFSLTLSYIGREGRKKICIEREYLFRLSD